MDDDNMLVDDNQEDEINNILSIDFNDKFLSTKTKTYDRTKRVRDERTSGGSPKQKINKKSNNNSNGFNNNSNGIDNTTTTTTTTTTTKRKRERTTTKWKLDIRIGNEIKYHYDNDTNIPMFEFYIPYSIMTSQDNEYPDFLDHENLSLEDEIEFLCYDELDNLIQHVTLDPSVYCDLDLDLDNKKTTTTTRIKTPCGSISAKWDDYDGLVFTRLIINKNIADKILNNLRKVAPLE